jgi:hypothetical protein
LNSNQEFIFLNFKKLIMILDRKKLLQKEALPIEKVDLGNGDFIYVKAMTGHERDLFEQSLLKEKVDEKGNLERYDRDNADFRAKLVVITACDESGKLIFEPTDYTELSRNMSIVTLEKIVAASLKLNKITEQDQNDLVKNSKAVPGGNSNLDSVVK